MMVEALLNDGREVAFSTCAGNELNTQDYLLISKNKISLLLVVTDEKQTVVSSTSCIICMSITNIVIYNSQKVRH